MKEFFASVLGGLIGAVGGMALKLMLPRWLFLGVGTICCAVMLIEIVVCAGKIIRERRRRKERVNRESQGK